MRRENEFCDELTENAAVKLAFELLDDDIRESCRGLAWCEVPYQDLYKVQLSRLLRDLIGEQKQKIDISLGAGHTVEDSVHRAAIAKYADDLGRINRAGRVI